MAFMDGLIARLALTVVAALLGLFLLNLYRVRSHVRSLQKQGMVSATSQLSYAHHH